MSNSKLAGVTILSPNCTKPRNHWIDKITIHHMAGNLTVEQCGALFAKESRAASANYGIGSDGRIGLYVEEENRSWCSGSRENDHRAITIEVANSGGAPDWPVLVLCAGFTLLWARIAARIANKASAKTLNRATGVILLVLGAAVLLVNIFQ